MQEQPADLSKQLSETDWEQTPESTKHLVKSLVERVEQLERQHEDLKVEHQLMGNWEGVNHKPSTQQHQVEDGKFEQRSRQLPVRWVLH